MPTPIAQPTAKRVAHPSTPSPVGHAIHHAAEELRGEAIAHGRSLGL